jgi:hypothetical protein
VALDPRHVEDQRALGREVTPHAVQCRREGRRLDEQAQRVTGDDDQREAPRERQARHVPFEQAPAEGRASEGLQPPPPDEQRVRVPLDTHGVDAFGEQGREQPPGARAELEHRATARHGEPEIDADVRAAPLIHRVVQRRASDRRRRAAWAALGEQRYLQW